MQGASEDNPESLAIIDAVVAMAQSLEMSTTAEGAEDADQADMVRRLGCTKIQGYYFGRPMPAKEALSLVMLRRNHATLRLSNTLSNSATPSVPPWAASTARSGWGIMPRTLPPAFRMPAISRCEPLQFSA